MNRRNGYTSIEVILVMLLLIAVSFLVFATVSAGSQAFFHLSEKRERDTDLRVGMSFIDVKIRKSDAVYRMDNGNSTAGIAVVNHPFDEGKALRFLTHSDTVALHTFVYCLDGELYELFQRAGDTPDASLAVPIARIDRMTVTAEDTPSGLIHIALTTEGGDRLEPMELSSWFYVRTGVDAT